MSVKRKLCSRRTLGWVAVTGTLVALPFGLSEGTASAHNWDGVARCESGGNWGINTGNGFYGGLQFTESTWLANGGSGNPSSAGKAEQVRVAENVLHSQGVGAWPVCGRYLSGSPSVGLASSVGSTRHHVIPTIYRAPTGHTPVRIRHVPTTRPHAPVLRRHDPAVRAHSPAVRRRTPLIRPHTSAAARPTQRRDS